MRNMPHVINKMPQVQYTKAQDQGLLQGQDQATTLENALRQRRQKLASEKIHLNPNPMEITEQ